MSSTRIYNYNVGPIERVKKKRETEKYVRDNAQYIFIEYTRRDKKETRMYVTKCRKSFLIQSFCSGPWDNYFNSEYIPFLELRQKSSTKLYDSLRDILYDIKGKKCKCKDVEYHRYNMNGVLADRFYRKNCPWCRGKYIIRWRDEGYNVKKTINLKGNFRTSKYNCIF